MVNMESSVDTVPPTSTVPDGVVFDCDGTIADTETLSKIAWRERLAEFGYQATQHDFITITGHPFPHNWDYFTDKVDLGDPAEFRHGLRTRFQELSDAHLEVYPDTIATMRAVADAGIPIAVASSSSREHVLRVLEQGEVGDLVAAVVAYGDTTHPKPHPDPYAEAVRRLSLNPHACVAVEDTPVGVASAVAAGLFTVAVMRRGTTPQVLAEADRVVAEVTFTALLR